MLIQISSHLSLLLGVMVEEQLLSLLPRVVVVGEQLQKIDLWKLMSPGRVVDPCRLEHLMLRELVTFYGLPLCFGHSDYCLLGKSPSGPKRMLISLTMRYVTTCLLRSFQTQSKKESLRIGVISSIHQQRLCVKLWSWVHPMTTFVGIFVVGIFVSRNMNQISLVTSMEPLRLLKSLVIRIFLTMWGITYPLRIMLITCLLAHLVVRVSKEPSMYLTKL
mmetsp:Transcript_4148/g.8872  ORF Transcript_4148/g.8872 Transcript_4148/m.8872 type:complete len:219 (-) Transcript_4148:821-1477(-)